MYRVLIGGMLLLSTPAAHAEVFRWTDAQGQVHYGAHPPTGDARRIELPSGGEAATHERQRLQRQRRLLDAYAYEREQKRARALQAATERERRQQRCAQLARQLRALSHAGPVYLRREDGGREFLSDAQRATQQQQLRAMQRTHCGGEP